MPRSITIYPGTFDPITLGHEDIVRRAAHLFDQVIVAIAAGHHKKAMFSPADRLAMAREALADIANVEIAGFDGLLCNFAATCKANAIVRGLRAVTDFDYEFQLAGMNRKLMPGVETIFLAPSDKYLFISSTLVREIAVLGGDISQFVSPGVKAQLSARLPATR